MFYIIVTPKNSLYIRMVYISLYSACAEEDIEFSRIYEIFEIYFDWVQHGTITDPYYSYSRLILLLLLFKIISTIFFILIRKRLSNQ